MSFLRFVARATAQGAVLAVLVITLLACMPYVLLAVFYGCLMLLFMATLATAVTIGVLLFQDACRLLDWLERRMARRRAT